MFQNFLKFCVALFLLSFNVTQSQSKVNGTITDAKNGSPIPGVNVILKGTSNGTSSDFDGNYSINVSGEKPVLIFSSVGYKTVEILVDNQSTINVSLEEGAEALDEVVVTALGISREKKSLGYAVTELSSDDISTIKETNLINSLSGKVAGVTITQGAFGPGSSSRVVIRGNNSLTGRNQPLYVVDGVPINSSGFGSASGTNSSEYTKTDYGNGVSDINPDDIASVSILKGPNASALYGSRASNGVVLITTKKGKSRNGIGVSYSNSTTFDTPLILPEYQNSYGQGSNGTIPTDLTELKDNSSSWGGRLDGSSQLYFTGDQKPYTAATNNVKDYFDVGLTMVNNVALDGGNEKINARFSYTKTDANSIVPNSGLKRHNFNLRTVAQLSSKLSIDAKGTYFKQYGKNRPSLGTQGLTGSLWTIPRNVNIKDLKDFRQDLNTLAAQSASTLGSNPYWPLYNDRNEDWRSRFYGFIKAEYQFTDWLKGFLRVGTDDITQKIENVTAYGHWFSSRGAFNYSVSQINETNADFLLMANRSLSDKLNLNVTFGGNHSYRVSGSQGLRGSRFRVPFGPPQIISEELIGSYTPSREKKVNSLYGTVNLEYDNWAYLEGSFRNDWSSALPESNRSYFYPSISLSLLPNQMLDIESDIVNFSKIRASWTEVGNDTDPFQLENVNFLAAPNDSYLNNLIAFTSDTKFNPNLKPESIKSTEIGVEFRLFKNKVFADFSWYKIVSNDLIQKVPVNPSTGFNYRFDNVGEIQNTGIEFVVGGTPFKNDNFEWETSFNFSKNKNKLVSLFDGQDSFPFSGLNGGGVEVRATVGGGFGEIYARDFLRNDQGQVVVGDDGIPIISNERILVGNYQPDWLGGLSNSFRYKDFRLNFLISGRFGGQFYSGTDASLISSGTEVRTLQYREGGVIVEGVVNTGTNDNPVYEPNTNSITAQQYWSRYSSATVNNVIDQTNIRLRELSITWNVPQNILKGNFIKGASMSVIGRNLFFLYKKSKNFDPESSYSVSAFAQGVLYNPVPTTRSLGFNLNIKL